MIMFCLMTSSTAAFVTSNVRSICIHDIAKSEPIELSDEEIKALMTDLKDDFRRAYPIEGLSLIVPSEFSTKVPAIYEAFLATSGDDLLNLIKVVQDQIKQAEYSSEAHKAMEKLGAMKDPLAIKVLLDMMFSGVLSENRSKAIFCLQDNPLTTTDILRIKEFIKDPEQNLRPHAVFLLHSMEDVPFLQDLLLDEKEEEKIRVAAGVRLAKLLGSSMEEQLVHLAVSLLEGSLYKALSFIPFVYVEDFEGYVTIGLQYCGDWPSVPELLLRLIESKAQAIRKEAAKSLNILSARKVE